MLRQQVPQMSVESPSEINWKEWAVKAGVTGAVAATAAYLLTGDGGSSVTVMGRSVPAPLLLGLGGAAGSLSADLTHQFVFPLIPHNAKYDKAEAAALSLAASGAGFYAVSVITGQPINPLPAFVIGSGSYAASDFLWNKFWTDQSGHSLWF